MKARHVVSRTHRRLAYLGASLVVAFAALGLVVTFIGRGGGADHSCPAGAGRSACSYPHGPWHWVEGLLVGSLVGFLLFAVGLAAQRILDK